MNGSPPPPPPHGEKPHTTQGENRNASDLPEGNYDIFVVPPHASGAGFLYLPSLQCHRNSFLAGSASTLFVVLVWVNLSPVFKAWYTLTIAVGGGGGASVWGMILLGIVSGLVGWGMGLWQADGGSTWRDTWSRGKFGGSGSKGPGAGGTHAKGSNSGDSGYGTGANTGSRPNSSNQRKGPDNAGWEKAREEEQREEERAREEEKQREKEGAREEARKREEIRAREEKKRKDEEKARQEKKRRDEEKAKDEARKRQEAKAREETRRKEEERAREETKRREELRHKMDEFKRKRDEESREKQRQRDHEAMERELRERKAQFEKEMAAAREAATKEARERAEKEAAEARAKVEREAAAARAKAEKEAAERRQRAEKEKAEKDAAEAKAREEKEAAEKEAAAKAAAKKEADAKFAALKEAAAKRYAEKKAKDAEEAAAKEAAAKEAAANGAPPRSPSPQKQATGNPDDSHKPYERARRPYGGASGHSGSSAQSESSYAASQSTARTSPPPSHHGFSSKDRDGYSTKDPDKIVISAVFAFNNNFVQTPVAQLVSGQGMVTDGLVLRITTEGLFIDDDIRGIPQREWDVKAWTMHMVEVWCPQYASAPQAREEPTKSSNPFRRGPPPGPTPEESDAYLMNLLKVCKNRCRLSSPGNKGDNVLGFEHQGLHILRAQFRDSDGKKYVFVLDETEGWKVAIGLQRLRRGTQVRALGVASMSVNDSNFLLENLGYIY